MKRKRATTGGDLRSGLDSWAPPPPEPRRKTDYAVLRKPGLAKAEPKRRKAPVMLGGQRCCVACGGGNGNSDAIGGQAAEPRVRCLACDGEYHPGCLDPPRHYLPRKDWVCGVCSSNSYHMMNFCYPRAPATTTALYSAAPRRQQQQQGVVVASHCRFMDVVSSTLTRLSNLSEGGTSDGGGGSGDKRRTASADQQQAQGAMRPVTLGAAATATTASTNWMASTSSNESRKGKTDVASMMADDVLSWALKNVGGSGEEGRMRKHFYDESLGDCVDKNDSEDEGEGGGPAVYHREASGDDRGLDSRRPLLSVAKRKRLRENARWRGKGVARSEKSGGSSSSFDFDGDSDFVFDSADSGHPSFWTDEEEEQERCNSVGDASDDGNGGGAYDYGGSDGGAYDFADNSSVGDNDSAWLEKGQGSEAESSEASRAQRRERRRSGSSSDSDTHRTSETRAANIKVDVAALSSCAPSHGDSAAATANAERESLAAVVVAVGSGSEEGGADQRRKEKDGFWEKNENTRFLKVRGREKARTSVSTNRNERSGQVSPFSCWEAMICTSNYYSMYTVSVSVLLLLLFASRFFFFWR